MADGQTSPTRAPVVTPIASKVDRVEAWTVAQAAEVLSISSAPSTPSHLPRGLSVTLNIPLDEDAIADDSPFTKREAAHTVYKRREPIRRDSLNRREALLKGKEGSRRRQRWENDRLLNNPYAEPPLPSDWEVRPTYPVHRVPYFVAPLWEAEFARTSQERRQRADLARQPASQEEVDAQKITQELRLRLKKARGAKGLLQDLENEVRAFVEQWGERQRQLEADGILKPESEDEEIVFIGRNGAMSDEKPREDKMNRLEKDKLVFESLLDDHGAGFGRYLVHVLGIYYGLNTYSVTSGDPALRSAYVGLRVDPKTRQPSLTRSELPRPLFAVV